MILKAFKEKSNQKIITKSVLNRKVEFNTEKIKTVGVLLNASEFNDYSKFEALFKSLKLNLSTHKCALFINKPNEEALNDHLTFESKDFGWRGKVVNLELQKFIATNFDVLISYYKSNSTALKLVTALSKADLKIGISNLDERLLDIIFDVEPHQFDTFKNEFKKYLTILNKL